jgi:CelD/BcsL family acetyltransferase involved in cellulose biosynthesis
VRRTLRDFERWAEGTMELQCASSPTDLARGFAVLKRLHDERWQAVGGCGAFASPLFSAFHERVLRLMMSAGTAELLWLEAHGRPVAALYQILWGDRALIYQAGRAVEMPKGVRPGIVLHLKAIEKAIQRGQREYDLLCGEARYKRQLAASERPLVVLDVWRPSVAQRACEALEEAAALTRGVLNHVSGWRGRGKLERAEGSPDSKPAPTDRRSE